MVESSKPPIACNLAPGECKERLAWIRGLARDALRGFKRNDLVLELRYAPEAADRVRELVRREEVCCAFLAEIRPCFPFRARRAQSHETRNTPPL